MRSFFVIAKKELVDCIRDKRSIVMMLLPLLIIPVSFFIIDSQMMSTNEVLKEEITICTDNEIESQAVVDQLLVQGARVNVISSSNAKSDLKSGKITLIVNKDNGGFHIIYDQSSIKSTGAANAVSAIIETAKATAILEELEICGGNKNVFNEYAFDLKDVSSDQDGGLSSLLSIVGPMLIVMLISSGGAGTAIDLFCGERERGSFEALLSTQVDRKSLYFAKNAIVYLFVCFSALISVIGYSISLVISKNGILPTLDEMQPEIWKIVLLLLISCVFSFFVSIITSFTS